MFLLAEGNINSFDKSKTLSGRVAFAVKERSFVAILITLDRAFIADQANVRDSPLSRALTRCRRSLMLLHAIIRLSVEARFSVATRVVG